MKALVLDASVAAKWYLPSSTESLVEQARELLTSHSRYRVRLAVPDLFWAELGNILWKARRQGRLDENSVYKAVADARRMGLATTMTESLRDDAMSIAMVAQRSVYDSLYVALAMHLNTELITADERLVNVVGAYFPVRWLGRYDLSVGGL